MEPCPSTNGTAALVAALQKLSDRLTSMREAQNQTSYRKVLSVEILDSPTISSVKSELRLVYSKPQAGVKKANGSGSLP